MLVGGSSLLTDRMHPYRTLALGLSITYCCCAQFVSLRSLQNALRDLARARIRLRFGLSLGQKLANCACAI